MQIIVAVIVGAVLGAAMLRGDGSWIVGGILGYLFARLGLIERRLSELQKTLSPKDGARANAAAPRKERPSEPSFASESHARHPETAAAPDSPPHRAPSERPAETAAAAFSAAPAERMNADLTTALHDAEGAAEARGGSELLDRANPRSAEPSRFQARASEPRAPESGTEPPALLPRTEPAAPEPGDKPRTLPPRAAPQSIAEPAPSVFEQLLAWMDRHLGSRNPLVLAGAVVMLFGVAFLLKYAVGEGWLVLSEPVRHLLIAAVAIAGIVFGARLERTRRDFAVSIQGAGYGTLFLTVFSAVRLSLIGGPAGFIAYVGLSSLAGVRAHRSGALPLALLALAGGFLAPVLGGEGGHEIAFFSYLLILDCSVLALSWVRAWRILNVASFGATLFLGIGWGIKHYYAGLFWSAEPFLVALFLLFAAIPVMFARHRPRGQGRFDAFLFYANPIAFLLLQARLMSSIGVELGWTLVALATGYAALCHWLKGREELSELEGAARLLAIVSAAYAVPLFVSERATSIIWALGSLLAISYGAEKNRRFFRITGIVLQLAAGIAFLSTWSRNSGETAFVNSASVGMVVLALTGFAGSWLTERSRIASPNRNSAAALFFWGVGWWFLWIFAECRMHVPTAYQDYVELTLFAATVLLADLASTTLQWKRPRPLRFVLLPFALYVALHCLEFTPWRAPAADFGSLVWPVAIAVLLSQLWRYRAEPFLILEHGGVSLLLHLLVWMELESLVVRSGFSSDLVLIVRALVPAAGLAVLLWMGQSGRWPVAENRLAYVGRIAVPNVMVLALWIFLTSASAGDPRNYLLVHLLDLISLGLLFVLAAWYRSALRLRVAGEPLVDRTTAQSLGVGLLIIVVNVLAARAVHHISGLPYRFGVLWESAVYQTTLTILWGALGVGLILVATKRAQRRVWLAGAAVLGAVVVKLFLVDLRHTGSGSQVISFVGIGALLLAVGYFAPLPPAEVRAEAKEI